MGPSVRRPRRTGRGRGRAPGPAAPAPPTPNPRPCLASAPASGPRASRPESRARPAPHMRPARPGRPGEPLCAGDVASRGGVGRRQGRRDLSCRCVSGCIALSGGVGGVAGPCLDPPTWQDFRPTFFGDTAGACQIDARSFAGIGRVQPGRLKDLLDGVIAHVWFALSCPNGAPLEFHDFGVEGWVQPCFERSPWHCSAQIPAAKSSEVL